MSTNKTHNKPLVLASSSPYRQELLRKLHLVFSTASPDVDETAQPDEPPKQLAKRLAVLKAHALMSQFPNHLIIGSDQVAMLGELQLHKPGSAEKAIKHLTVASGKQAIFYTSLCLLDSSTGQYITDVDKCTVHFRTLTHSQIKRYVELDEPYNCAAGFKSEAMGIALFEKIEGDDPNALIGLPLIRLIRMLEAFGHPVL
jgi:MAF protein